MGKRISLRVALVSTVITSVTVGLPAASNAVTRKPHLLITVDGGGGDARTYVALGDSYSSGEGLTPFAYGSASDGCDRSSRSYPALVNSAYGFASFKFAACSGALLSKFNQSQKQEVPEYDATDDSAPDVVTLTGGGNDLGFADLIQACMYQGWGPFHYGPNGDCAGKEQNALNLLAARLDSSGNVVQDSASANGTTDSWIQAQWKNALWRIRTGQSVKNPKMLVAAVSYPMLLTSTFASHPNADCKVASDATAMFYFPWSVWKFFVQMNNLLNAEIGQSVAAENGHLASELPSWTRFKFVNLTSDLNSLTCGQSGLPQPDINGLLLVGSSSSIVTSPDGTILNDGTSADGTTGDALSIDPSTATQAQADAVFAELQAHWQPYHNGSFHPTASGQSKIASAVEPALAG